MDVFIVFKQIFISIHALVKRATFLESLCVNACAYFNPRPREEGDMSLLKYQA